jgi:exosortase
MKVRANSADALTRRCGEFWKGLMADGLAVAEISAPVRNASRPKLALRDDRVHLWHVAAAGALVTLSVLTTIEAWADIWHIASIDEEYSHIFIVPIVAAVLIWIRRSRLRHCRPTGTMLGPVMAGIGWFCWSYGYANGVQSMWHGGAVLTALGCAVSVLGKNVLFRFFPAVAVLVFLIPVPGGLRQDISLPLQRYTAEASQVALQIVGIDTQVRGNTLDINNTTVTVAEACNGMRGLFALIMVAYTFAFALPLRQWVRIIVLICSPLAALICNILRTVPTIWLYGNYPQNIADEFHNWSGWAMLPVAFLMLYAIIRLLKWAGVPVVRYPLASQGV